MNLLRISLNDRPLNIISYIYMCIKEKNATQSLPRYSFNSLIVVSWFLLFISILYWILSTHITLKCVFSRAGNQMTFWNQLLLTSNRLILHRPINGRSRSIWWSKRVPVTYILYIICLKSMPFGIISTIDITD